MASPIIFYHDFVSPNSYLGIPDIMKVAAKHGREIEWRVISLFYVWDAIDYHPLGKPKQKARYIVRDFQRCAKIEGKPLVMPSNFPLDAKLAQHSFYRMVAKDRTLAQAFAVRVSSAYWGEGGDIADPAVLESCAKESGADPADIAAAEGDEAAAAALKAANDQAVADNLFGTPFYIVDDEPFWGHDRVSHVDWALSQ